MSACFTSSDRGLIDDYRGDRALALKRAKEIRRRRAYFLKGSLAYGHRTLGLGAEQSRMIELREKCLEARQVAIMQQALRDEPSPSDLDMLADGATALGRAA